MQMLIYEIQMLLSYRQENQIKQLQSQGSCGQLTTEAIGEPGSPRPPIYNFSYY